MDNQKGVFSDLLGIGKPTEIIVEKACTFLGAICMPAAEELGLWFQDKVRLWRLKNAISVIDKAKGRLEFGAEGFRLEAHPKVVLGILDSCSLEEDDLLQEMWAGLIVSNCKDKDGKKEDSDILYVEMLKKLTSKQARILNYICKECKKVKDSNGLFWAHHIELSSDDIFQIVGSTDLYKIDAEIDQLVNFGLIQKGDSFSDPHGAGFCFRSEKLAAQLEPSPLALNLFVKCQGYEGNVVEYFQITEIAPPPTKLAILTSTKGS